MAESSIYEQEMLTATKIYQVLNESFPGCVHSGPNGVALHHNGKILLRVEPGSGIGGVGYERVAIMFPGNPGIEPICGIVTETLLKAKLRNLIIEMFELGLAAKKLQSLGIISED